MERVKRQVSQREFLEFWEQTEIEFESLKVESYEDLNNEEVKRRFDLLIENLDLIQEVLFSKQEVFWIY